MLYLTSASYPLHPRSFPAHPSKLTLIPPFFFFFFPSSGTRSKNTTKIVVSSLTFLVRGGLMLNTPFTNPLLVPPHAFLARQAAAFSSSIAKYSGSTVHDAR